MKQKIDFYLRNKIQIHIETANGRFYNGLILECSNNHLILLDKVLGEIFLMFSEINVLEKNKFTNEKREENQ